MDAEATAVAALLTLAKNAEPTPAPAAHSPPAEPPAAEPPAKRQCVNTSASTFTMPTIRCTLCTMLVFQPATCHACNQTMCVPCVQKKLDASPTMQPHCPCCQKGWSHVFASETLGNHWFHSQYKANRAEVAQTYMHAIGIGYAPLLAIYRKIEAEKQLRRTNTDLIRDLKKTNAKVADLKPYQTSNKESLAREQELTQQYHTCGWAQGFTLRCPDVMCPGFMDANYKCVICPLHLCGDCFLPMTTAHACVPANKQRAQQIKDNALHCPDCNTAALHHLQGVAFCGQCHHVFTADGFVERVEDNMLKTAHMEHELVLPEMPRMSDEEDMTLRQSFPNYVDFRFAQQRYYLVKHFERIVSCTPTNNILPLFDAVLTAEQLNHNVATCLANTLPLHEFIGLIDPTPLPTVCSPTRDPTELVNVILHHLYGQFTSTMDACTPLPETDVTQFFASICVNYASMVMEYKRCKKETATHEETAINLNNMLRFLNNEITSKQWHNRVYTNRLYYAYVKNVMLHLAPLIQFATNCINILIVALICKRPHADGSAPLFTMARFEQIVALLRSKYDTLGTKMNRQLDRLDAAYQRKGLHVDRYAFYRNLNFGVAQATLTPATIATMLPFKWTPSAKPTGLPTDRNPMLQDFHVFKFSINNFDINVTAARLTILLPPLLVALKKQMAETKQDKPCLVALFFTSKTRISAPLPPNVELDIKRFCANVKHNVKDLSRFQVQVRPSIRVITAMETAQIDAPPTATA